CAAENGVVVMASSCEPDPCPPPTSTDIVRCCIAEDSGDSSDGENDNEDNQAECEQLSTAECANENGTPMGTGSCDPNPCAMTTASTTLEFVGLPQFPPMKRRFAPARRRFHFRDRSCVAPIASPRRGGVYRVSTRVTCGRSVRRSC